MPSTIYLNQPAHGLDRSFAVEHTDHASVRVEIVQARLEQLGAGAAFRDADVVLGMNVRDLNHGATLLQRHYGIRQTGGDHPHRAMIVNSEEDARRKQDLDPAGLGGERLARRQPGGSHGFLAEGLYADRGVPFDVIDRSGPWRY